MVSDKAGNVYLGGTFQSSVTIAGVTLEAKVGGDSETFLAKYGTSNCKPMSVMPVANPAGGASLVLAPNPSTTETQISYQLGSNAGSLEVYDLAGRMLFRKVLGQKAGTEKLSLAEYVPGLYLVVLREADEVVLHRRLSVVR